MTATHGLRGFPGGSLAAESAQAWPQHKPAIVSAAAQPHASIGNVCAPIWV